MEFLAVGYRRRKPPGKFPGLVIATFAKPLGRQRHRYDHLGLLQGWFDERHTAHQQCQRFCLAGMIAKFEAGYQVRPGVTIGHCGKAGVQWGWVNDAVSAQGYALGGGQGASLTAWAWLCKARYASFAYRL